MSQIKISIYRTYQYPQNLCLSMHVADVLYALCAKNKLTQTELSQLKADNKTAGMKIARKQEKERWRNKMAFRRCIIQVIS